jgi:hypothetical protein
MTTPAPTLADAPTAAEMAEVTCPVDRARQVTSVARRFGTLPGPLADLRRTALLEARKDHGVRRLAAEVGLSPARISQITAVSPERPQS